MAVFVRGAAARSNSAASLPEGGYGADPGPLPTGYYLVREEKHWRICRWRRHLGTWEMGGGFQWPRRHWDEIGAKVA